MPHIFISYSRKNQPYVRELAEDIRQRGFDVWMDDRIDYGDRWWRTIVQAIEDCAAFVVIMSPDAEKSEWVEREVLLAQREGKPTFPVLLEGKEFALLITTQFVNVTGGKLPANDFYERIAEVITPAPVSGTWITPPKQSITKPMTYVIGILVLVAVIVIGAVALSSFNGAGTPNPAIAGVTTPDLTGTLDAMVTSILATNIANETATAAAFTPTPTPTDTPTATDTPDTAQTLAAQNTEAAVIAANFLATQQAQLTANAPTDTPQPTATATETPTASPTATDTPTITPTATLDLPSTAAAATRVQQEAVATLNAQATQAAQATLPPAETLAPLGVVVSSQNINLRSGPGTDNAIVAVLPPGTQVTVLENAGAWLRVRLANGTEGYIASTLLDVIGTPTPTWTPNPTIAALAQIRVTHNADWQPYERDFNGVTMVLVPAGCFMMGSEDGSDDEKPIHEQCFDAPFWIDKYEVTNAQYGSTGCESYSSDPGQPRNCVSWFDAQDFCEARGGRLPTEAEWEYAARGPDSLAYPWGNEFIAENAVYSGNSNDQTAEVGSRPGGASWVGALDMSGNVWEWVSTIYQAYPYDADDGRESNSDTNSARMLRGGSWYDLNTDFLRAANRVRFNPDSVSVNSGFRCVRS